MDCSKTKFFLLTLYLTGYIIVFRRIIPFTNGLFLNELIPSGVKGGSSMTINVDVQLDAKGLACPMPIVKTKKAMSNLVDGQILEVTATDKGSKADLKAWADTVGHQYIGTIEDGELLKHYIRKCSDDTVVEKVHEQVLQNEELLNHLKEEDLLLDVRESAEFAFGHIAGAKSIPLGELEDRMNELDKSATVYVICRTGKRSDLAAQKLASNGFDNVWNVMPGMTSWTGELTKEI